jgi:multidrug efflux pump subunit AcrA (membrane-fusion protein)
MRRTGQGSLCTLTTIAIGLSSAVGGAEETPEPPREIHLTECRIRLSEEVVLASDRNGILKFVEPREGDTVRARQKVAGLVDDVVQAELAAAEHKASNDVEVRAGKKASELADMEYKKAKQANRSVANTVPSLEVHKLEIAAEHAVLDIELAEHELTFYKLQRDLKRQELATLSIISPINGVVRKVHKHKGEAVRQGDPVLEIANTDLLRVEGWVDLKDTWDVSIGNRVFVQLDIPDVELAIEERRFAGRITFVDVSVQPVTRKTKVYADVVNQDDILKAGLNAMMTIQVDPSNKANGTGADVTTARRSKADGPARVQRTNRIPIEDKSP